MKKAFFAILSLVFIFLACKKEEPITAQFWPLAEGNKWTTSESYSWELTGPTGTTSDSSGSETSNTVKASEEREDGKLVWPVETVVQGDTTFTSISYYHITEDSIYVYSLKDSEEPQSVEPNNLAIGVQWDGTLAIPLEIPNFPTDLDARYKVIASETVTDVPAATFDCLVIQIDITQSGYEVDSAATQWRAEGVGMVKMTTEFQKTLSLGGFNFDLEVIGSSKMKSKNF